MIDDKQALIRAVKERLHEDLICGLGVVQPLESTKSGLGYKFMAHTVEVRHHNSIAVRYQILHMFFNAGVSKTTLMKTHRRRFTGKHQACLWCWDYLRRTAHKFYAYVKAIEKSMDI
tara:strand:- start:224 stop:574 length:351 start_codon:yes stop_codon:yes gene_type:complete